MLCGVETYIALLQPFRSVPVSAGVGCTARKCSVRRVQRVKKRVVRTGVHCGGGAGQTSVHQKAKIGVAKELVKG